ncbi:MAG: hypothetical protein KAU20_06770 [Nanoarchaeota archaeon]|nr:hypothetical protein [Nanoarchaeota archaeon]
MRHIIIFSLILLIVLPVVSAEEYTLPLLAVKDTETGFKGSTAILKLEIKEGSGRVFLDTFPLTKLDTQMSTRFAKEIACDYIDYGCNNYDFIYTIKSDSVIVGGPSAGAAISALTISALENLDIKEKTTITGTINSGGLVGSVGGLKEKIDAGYEIGLKKILIPKGERFVKEDDVELIKLTANITLKINNSINKNKSLDLIEYGKEKGIEIIEVSTLDEILYHLAGKEIEKLDLNLEIDNSYKETMKNISIILCNRSEKLKNELLSSNLTNKSRKIYNDSIDYIKRAKASFENKEYYSSASYCFSANTKLFYLTIKNKNLTNESIAENVRLAKSGIKKISNTINKKELKTITDLETYMIVKERLIDAENNLKAVLESEDKEEKIFNLAYAIERLGSAVSWSNFFGTGKKEFNLNKENLKKSCINKLAEAEERYEYVKLYIKTGPEKTEQEIKLAKTDLENGDYELCLFKASKAKAESDIILNTIGLEEGQLNNTIHEKLNIVKENIIKGQQKGIFPIIGYSYYEYTNSLKEHDIYSALLFAEYSLELSNLDLYFKEEAKPLQPKIKIEKSTIMSLILVFVSGLLIGMGAAHIMFRKNKKKKK